LTDWINWNTRVNRFLAKVYKFGSVHCYVDSGCRRSTGLQHSLKPAVHVLNKVFDSNIVLIASFVRETT